MRTSQTYDIVFNKFDEGNPGAWIKHAASMESIIVGQDVTDAYNKFLMIWRMLFVKALMDFDSCLTTIRKKEKLDVDTLNAASANDATVMSYDEADALTDDNLANCLKAVATKVFMIGVIKKQQRYMRRFMNKLCTLGVSEFANRLLKMNWQLTSYPDATDRSNLAPNDS